MLTIRNATRSLPKCFSALLAGLALSAAAYGQAPAIAAHTGVYLAGPNGMTLYTFDRDQANSGKSVCNDQCAVNWPPLAAASMPAGGDWTHIRRDDGSMQLAYKGQPLYFWLRDAKPGDKTGHGVNNVWRIATP